MFDIQQLRNFIMTAELHNITAAADRLHIAQPALSLQIKTMEEAVGTRLFIRKPRSVELTEAGKIYYDAARQILRLEDNVLTSLSDLIRGESGTLKLGITPLSQDLFLNSCLQEYCRAYPRVRYEIYEDHAEALLDYLDKNIIEIAFIRSPFAPDPSFEQKYYYREQLYAYYQEERACDFPENEPLSLSAVSRFPLCATRGYADTLMDLFADADLRPEFRCICSSRNMALQMVAAADLVALMPASPPQDCGTETSSVRCRKLEAPGFHSIRSLVVGKGRSLSLAAQYFIDLVQHSQRNQSV